MRDRYVIDTNVLIAASAADPFDPADIDATPADPELRIKVWEWLDSFQRSDCRMVLDREGKIYDEYCNKLNHGDFGVQVVMAKWSTDAVDSLEILYDEHGDGALPATLEEVIHDRADRKMVGASLESKVQFGEGCVAFAGDTDWHDWEEALVDHGLVLEPIIEAWSRAKHAEKNGVG